MSSVPTVEFSEEQVRKCYEKYSVRHFTEDKELGTVKQVFRLFGNCKQFLSPFYYNHKDFVKNIEIRSDDVWIFGFPRSGTTLTQEMTWLLDHNLDFETALKVKLNYRNVFFDTAFLIPENDNKIMKLRKLLAAENFDYMDQEKVLNRQSPRHFKTHFMFELMPDNLIEKSKVFYLAREVKDVIVSMFHFEKFMKQVPMDADFKTYCNHFIDDNVFWGPYFPHIKEGWSKRHHPNVMFMFYEDIIKDLQGTIRRVSKFLGKEYTEKQYGDLYQHLQFDNMKKNEAVNPAEMQHIDSKEKSERFIRKGKSGSWREYFDEELLEKTEAWIAMNLADTDLRFPTPDPEA